MKKLIKEVLSRVEFWPEERQQQAARVLLDMEAQERNSVQLTHDQVIEIERRVSDPNARFLPLGDVRARLAKRGA